MEIGLVAGTEVPEEAPTKSLLRVPRKAPVVSSSPSQGERSSGEGILVLSQLCSARSRTSRGTGESAFSKSFVENNWFGAGEPKAAAGTRGGLGSLRAWFSSTFMKFYAMNKT